MKKEDLIKLISQIKKYDLTKTFDTPEEFDKWVYKLNSNQVNNFNSLTINPEMILFPVKLLIDENLLNCDDYTKRIEAMTKLRNGDGCYHLFDRLCAPNFLNSKSYYKDMEMISKAKTARYALWVIHDGVFINSPFHDEDLRLIVESRDTVEDEPSDEIVWDVLATVACNIDSIRSPYHQSDMRLIATVGSDCLQRSCTYPEHSLNNLAVSKESLADKYHLENMQILAKKPIASEYLYDIMTDSSMIAGIHYRKEVQALVNAKSKVKALAIYQYIKIADDIDVNITDYYDVLREADVDYQDMGLLNRRNRVLRGCGDQKYLDGFNLLNKVEDQFVLFIENILTNEINISSGNQEFDLNLLLSVTDKNIFRDLFRLMIHDVSLRSKHHRDDALLISKTVNEKVRKLLLQKATNRYSVASENHRDDMQYILNLDLESMDEEISRKIRYYLFNETGINHPEHKIRLEKLYRGESLDDYDSLLEHLNHLEMYADDIIIPDNVDTPSDKKGKRRVLSIIKGWFGKR